MGEMIAILLFLYGFVIVHLIRHAADVFRTDWKRDRKSLGNRLLLLSALFAVLLLVNFLVLNVNRDTDNAASGSLQCNIALGIILFSGILAFFAERKIFTAFMGLLYLYDLIMFHHYVIRMNGNGLEDFALGINSMLNNFINLFVFAAALLLDRAVPLEEPDDGIF